MDDGSSSVLLCPDFAVKNLSMCKDNVIMRRGKQNVEENDGLKRKHNRRPLSMISTLFFKNNPKNIS